MMKRLTFLLAFFLLVAMQVNAQKTVRGTVTDDNGDGIPGATVRVKEVPNVGTITDLDGKYTLEVPQGGNTLVISFVGLETQELPVKGDIVNAVLKQSDQKVEEVVVTALGIKRETKKLGYSATQVDNEEITRTKDRSVLNSLQGKVAGVNITSASGAPGASTRVIMRGFNSITGANQPLYVIDGVPLNNSSSGSSSINGGTDFGNAANDLNPEDIESVTILKGSSGTALYGSRASNGVIIITTKGGKEKKSGLEVTVSSSAQFDSPMRLPQWQNDYGQGFYGMRDIRENTSWGPKFDGEMRYWGYNVDGQRKIKKYEALPNNVRDFFDIGHTFNNALTFTGGSEKTNFYVSYSNVYSDGIMPQDHDIYDRHTIAVRGQAELANNFTASGSMNYIKKQSQYVSTGQGAVSVYNQILQIPRDIPINELEDYESPWNNLNNFYSAYMVNPYYVLNEYGNDNNHERVFGNATISYKFNQYLSSTFRVGSDITNEMLHLHHPIIDPEGINNGNESWVNTNEGSVEEQSTFRREINTDFIINYSRTFKDFDFSLMLGHNVNQRNAKVLYAGVVGLDIPKYYNLVNSGNIPTIAESESFRRLVGAYFNGDFTFFNMIYLTTTYRRDWSSTLPAKNNNYGYPGANLSFVFTEAFPDIKRIVEFGKIRVGWAKVGNDAPAYRIHSTLNQGSFSNGYEGTGLVFPLKDGINSYTVGNLIGNPELKPEFKTETEFGTDLRLFNGRFNIDFTYYQNKNTDLIFTASLPSSSGYEAQTLNFGELSNKGVELLITITPVKTKDFTWSLTGNYSKNKNKVVKLPESMLNAETGEREYTLMGIGLPATGYTSFTAYEGYPLAIFTVNAPEVVEDVNSPYYGKIIVDRNNGLPIVSSNITKLGSSNYDYMAGFGSSLSYKDFTLTFNVDIRQGGLMYSRTCEMTYFSGTAVETLNNDRQPFIIENAVVEVLNSQNQVVGYEENITPIINSNGNMHNYWGGGAELLNKKFVIDKSFVKLRDVSLSYRLPKSMLKKVFIGSLDISIIGRNLLCYTPKENRWIDPEATSFGNDLTADYGEYGTTPSIRSIIFNLKFTF